MQRGVGSIRVTHRGTRFVSPAGNGRRPHPLSRSHSQVRPVVPQAARVAIVRDPLGAVRRSARSLTPGRPAPITGLRTMRPASIHWSTPRRALRDPRSFRAATDSR